MDDKTGILPGILIAEDSPSQALQVRHFLEQRGYRVFAARNGREALELIRKERPGIVVSDVIMPEMDGYELCRHIKADDKLRDIHFILLTVLSDPQDIIRGIACGADDFVIKPFHEASLFSRLEQTLEIKPLKEFPGRDRRQGLEITYKGEQVNIPPDSLKIMRLLLSIYEDSAEKNRELLNAQLELRDLNEKLEGLVEDRTAALREKNMALEEAYAQLKTAHDKVFHQDKLASLGLLAAGLAHEVNNPLGFIMSNLASLRKYLVRLAEFIEAQSVAIEALATEQQGGEQSRSSIVQGIKEKRQEQKLDYIMEDVWNLVRESLEGAERARGIVQDLKNFARVDKSDYYMADINAGLESTINIVWNELKYKVTLKKEYGDLPLTRCNPGQLNQVFMNILVNAAHAIEDRGEVTIKTWPEGGCIYVSVSDVGCGIPEDKLSAIFEPFFTTKEVGKGTGLGLSIAYDIIKKHNGDISVKSKVGHGTTFTIKIPVVEK